MGNLQLTIRSMNWHEIWLSVVKKERSTHYSTDMGEQDIFNAVFVHHPDLVFTIPCQWNFQLSNHHLWHLCSNADGVKTPYVIHFNSPKKFKATTAVNFVGHYMAVQQYDGTLLRTGPLDCHLTNTMKSYETEGTLDDEIVGKCEGLKNPDRRLFRQDFSLKICSFNICIPTTKRITCLDFTIPLAPSFHLIF